MAVCIVFPQILYTEKSRWKRWIHKLMQQTLTMSILEAKLTFWFQLWSSTSDFFQRPPSLFLQIFTLFPGSSLPLVRIDRQTRRVYLPSRSYFNETIPQGWPASGLREQALERWKDWVGNPMRATCSFTQSTFQYLSSIPPQQLPTKRPGVSRVTFVLQFNGIFFLLKTRPICSIKLKRFKLKVQSW